MVYTPQPCLRPDICIPLQTKFNLSDGSITDQYFVDQYAITVALEPFKCFPLRARIGRIISEPHGSARTQGI